MNVESTAVRFAIEAVRAAEPRIADAITKELDDQREQLKRIAKEDYASPAVLLAVGNWLSDKYAEGTVGRGPGFFDVVNGDGDTDAPLLTDPRVQAAGSAGSTTAAHHVYVTGTAYDKPCRAGLGRAATTTFRRRSP